MDKLEKLVKKRELSIKSFVFQAKSFFKKYFFILFLLILPVLLSFWFVAAYGVNIVFLDSWSRIPLLEHYFQGTLTFNDFFTQHNEHRILFFNIIFLGIALLTHWNGVMEMYFSLFLIILICFAIFYLYYRQWGVSQQSLIKFLPVPWLLFNFRQWESFLQADQFCVYLCILGFFIAIIFIEITERIDYKFGIAILGGIVSTFSFFNGLLVWPVGLLFIYLRKTEKKIFLLIWGIVGVASYSLYFFNWKKPVNTPGFLYAFEDPQTAVQYFIANVGSPLGFDPITSISMGFIFIGLFICLLVIILKSKRIRENAVWLSLIFFSLGASLLMTMGRSGFGIGQAISSRYVSFTVIGIIGLFLIILTFHDKSVENHEKSSLFLGIMTGIIIFSVLIGNISGVIIAEQYKDNNEKMANYLIGYSTATDDQLKQLFPDPTVVREGAVFLERNHLNVFYSSKNEFRLNKPIPVHLYEGQTYFTGSGKVGNDNKYILYEHPFDQNKSIFYFDNIPIMSNSVLRFDTALDPNVWSPDKGDGVEFQIYVNNVTPENLIFSQYIDPKHNISDRRWNSYEIDLSAYKGSTIRLLFSTSPGPVNDGRYDWAWWAEPRITMV